MARLTNTFKDTLCMDAHECAVKHLGKDDAVGTRCILKSFTRQILIGMKFPPLRAYEDYLLLYINFVQM